MIWWAEGIRRPGEALTVGMAPVVGKGSRARVDRGQGRDARGLGGLVQMIQDVLNGAQLRDEGDDLHRSSQRLQRNGKTS